MSLISDINTISSFLGGRYFQTGPIAVKELETKGEWNTTGGNLLKKQFC